MSFQWHRIISFEIDYQTSSRGLFDEGESLADELDWVSNQSATVVVSKGEDPSSFASIPLDDADDVSVEFVAPKSESVHSDTNESQEVFYFMNRFMCFFLILCFYCYLM